MDPGVLVLSGFLPDTWRQQWLEEQRESNENMEGQEILSLNMPLTEPEVIIFSKFMQARC
jgi:hypothetical protein